MKRRFQLNERASDIFVLCYLLLTLCLRFFLEPQLQGHLLASVGLGGFALLMLWAVYKSKFIRPTWFGLFRYSK
ncbi:MAG: hypothetical protein AAGI23_20585 [Bacteroidota bacterium]